MFKFLVIEDHALVREGLLQSLSGLAPDPRPLGAGDSETALASLEAHPDIELVILDLMLPGLNGTSLLSVLRKRYPTIPVAVLSALEDTETVRKVMRLGASAYVSKSSSSKILIGALRKVLAGEVYVPEKYASLNLERRQKVRLTPAQSRVLDLLTEGYSNQQIADLLGISVGTVKLHFVSVYKTLKVKSRAQALIAVRKRKLRP